MSIGKTKALRVIPILLLTSCGLTPQGDLVRAVLTEGGKKIVEKAIKDNEWFLCRGAPIGAILKHYKGRMKAYNNFCRPREDIDTTSKRDPKLGER